MRYRYCILLSLFIYAFLSVTQLHAVEKPSVEPVTDLRILVDVSGSMRRNDPKNLRRDALRLLIGMLPKTSRVGIWTFGQYVNMQVKPGFATPEWKKNARKEASTIHSRGLYTNIEDTLTKSSWDWKRPDPKWDRHIILLTDGMVDISRQAKKNQASRNKILGKILAELTSANVKVHTIALSAQADHDLLKKIAKQSDGWYESVNSADKLQRIFLRLFEKTTKMDSVPLEGNYFDVDKSISDMTLLVFRSKSGAATKIIRPDGAALIKQAAPKNVEWYQDNSFDIITIHKPKEGKWKLDADIDKDNRVKVVTNLKLHVAPLPTNIIKDEAVSIKASLLTKGQLLSDKELLGLVKVTLHSTNQKGVEQQQKIQSAETKGTYEAVIDGVNEVGDVQFIVRVTAPTFKRESRHAIKVHKNPVRLSLSATDEGLIISVTEDPKLIQTGTLQLALSIEGQAGAYYVLKDAAHSWKAVIDKSFAGKKITINASATRLGNIAFRTQLHGKLPEPIIPLADPLTVSVEESESGVFVKALLTENILQTGTLKLAYSIKDSTEPSNTIIEQKSLNLWQQLLIAKHSGKTLLVTANGRGLNGEEFKKSYEVVVPELPVQEKKSEPEPDQPESIDTSSEAPENSDSDSDESHSNKEEESSLILILSITFLANILVFGGGYFGYRYWKKTDQPLDDDFDTVADDSSKDDGGSEANAKENKTADLDEPESLSNDLELNKESDDDFSSQRKQKEIPDNVDLDLDSKAEDEPEIESTTNDDMENSSDENDVLDTASADDLPEFDIDMDSDVGGESIGESIDLGDAAEKSDRKGILEED